MLSSVIVKIQGYCFLDSIYSLNTLVGHFKCKIQGLVQSLATLSVSYKALSKWPDHLLSSSWLLASPSGKPSCKLLQDTGDLLQAPGDLWLPPGTWRPPLKSYRFLATSCRSLATSCRSLATFCRSLATFCRSLATSCKNLEDLQACVWQPVLWAEIGLQERPHKINKYINGGGRWTFSQNISSLALWFGSEGI